jgi:predicted glycoside hydrolase/deacetylase ChbG (UPF0249 family)
MSNVICSNDTFGRVTSTTCLVNSVVGVEVPKFSKDTLKRYCSLGINRPWLLAESPLAKGTVIFDSVDIAI